MKHIYRNDDEIDEVVGKCADAMNEGSKYPGLSYEEGVLAMLYWLTGASGDNPMED